MGLPTWEVIAGEKLVFDLGVRKDVSTASKNWQDRLAAGVPFEYGPDVAETLTQNGYDLKDINAVIWRHIRSVTARRDGADVWD